MGRAFVDEPDHLVRPIDVCDDQIAARIVEIQRAAYAIEAELMSFDGIPPLHETVDDVQSREDLNWDGAFEDGLLAGLIAWSENDQGIEIDRLAIDPAYSRRGYGRELLRTLPSSTSIRVSTGRANLPAIGLYENEGFTLTGNSEVAPGVLTSQFYRPAST